MSNATATSPGREPALADRALRILLVSTAHPPRRGAGAVRLDALQRLLPGRGIDVTVLRTSHTGTPPGPGSVAALSPVDLFAERSGRSGRANWGSGTESRIRRIIIPDPWISWVPFAVIAGIREARRRGGFDAIVSSSPNESSHLAGWALAALLRVPWIADLRDPWWSNSRRTGRDGWIGRADAALGRLVLRRARHITTASAPWTEQIAAELPAVPVSFVMNGTADSTGPRDDPPADASTLVYTGLLHGRRQFSPPFLAAIRDANVVRAQRGAAPLTLEVYGPPSEDLAAAASDADASDVVRQHGVVERSEAIAAQRAAGAVVVVIGDNPTEVECLPAKLFEYISTGRPIVVLGPRENEAARLVEAHGLGVSASDEDIARLVEMLTSTTLQAARHDAPETAHELSQDRMACEFADTIAMIVDDDHRTRV